MRADARRNRAALLAAAAEVYAERGVDAPLEEVARRAGVGIGTLYRHFPTRLELVEAVYHHEVETRCCGIDELLADNSPDVALVLWMRRFVHYAAVKRGLIQMMRGAVAADADVFAYTHRLVHDAMQQLVSAAVDAGTIRADAEPDDLLRGVSGFCMVGEQPGWQERAARLIDLLVDGLRYRAPAAPK